MTENKKAARKERDARQFSARDLNNPKYLSRYAYGTYRLIDGTVISITEHKIGTGSIDVIKVLQTNSSILRMDIDTEYLTVGKCKSPVYERGDNISQKRYAWRSTLRNLVRRTIEKIIKDREEQNKRVFEKMAGRKESEGKGAIVAQKISYAREGDDALNDLRAMKYGIYRLPISNTVVEVKMGLGTKQRIVEVVDTNDEILKGTSTFIFGWQLKRKSSPTSTINVPLVRESTQALHTILRKSLQM